MKTIKYEKVEWTDSSSPSWEDEENFDLIDIINDYWTNKAAESNESIQQKRS